MKLFYRYILFFLFLVGFSFTGKNKGPLLSGHATRTEESVQCTDFTNLYSTVDPMHFEQLLYVNDTDNNEDVNSLSQRLQRLAINNLAVYYFSLIKTQDPAPVAYAGFVHEIMPIPAVPKFIRFHQLLIPFSA
ncbi:hypothetical protein SAMN05444266_109126 [Chitinophaga jiangningensis]|uniref:Uncharacterized protein n=1 Tax=Chitinophaga jiangningensis TaxID=1419482 RepID=A0A1M7K2Z6_9BACT|nr:hypothetical protein [Chitinophaga jiangningensis]SHM59564.1 hypothetical protein SAMN05444266_109126 [Chitinophaga jiangningensis]